MSYIYQAELYCDVCGRDICEQIQREREEAGLEPFDDSDQSSYDSDEFPKGPYPDDEESDIPQHCGSLSDCLDPTEIDGQKYGHFFGNDLTAEGVRYLQESLNDDPGNPVVQFWVDYYRAAGVDLGFKKRCTVSIEIEFESVTTTPDDIANYIDALIESGAPSGSVNAAKSAELGIVEIGFAKGGDVENV